MNRSGGQDRGKIIALDFERIEAMSDMTTCVALTEKAREMLLTIAPQLAWATRWTNADGSQVAGDIRREAIGDWAAACIDALMNDDNECENLRKCRDYPMSSPFVTIEPQDPYTDPEYVPDGYIFPPFWVMGLDFDLIWSTLGILPGDLMTDLIRFPGGGFPPAPIASGFARFRVNVRAGDELEIHFISFPTAGSVLLTKNGNPLTAEAIDLHMDVIGTPPETMTILAYHWYVDSSAPDQYIDVTFVPTVQDESIPIRYGGGVRKLTICRESDGGIMLRQNPEDPCQLEQSLDDGESWTLAFDYSLCIRPHEQMLIEAALKTLTDPDDPDSPGGSAIYDPDDEDPETTAPERQATLCYAATKTVDVLLDAYIAAHDGQLTPATVTTFVLAIVGIFGAVALPVIVALCIAIAFAALAAYVLFLGVLTVEMAEDPDIRAKMTCMLYSHLLMRPATLPNFQSAYDDRSCLTADESTVALFMAAAIHSPFGPRVHEAFLGLLGAGHTALKSGQTLDGDCSDCGTDGWCKRWTADEVMDEWTLTAGVFLPGTPSHIRIGPAYSTGAGTWFLYAVFTNAVWIPEGTTVTMIRWYFTRSVNNQQAMEVSDGDGVTAPGVIALNEGWKAIANPGAYSKTERVIKPYVYVATNGITDTTRLRYIEMSGTGPNPFDECNSC